MRLFLFWLLASAFFGCALFTKNNPQRSPSYGKEYGFHTAPEIANLSSDMFDPGRYEGTLLTIRREDYSLDFDLHINSESKRISGTAVISEQIIPMTDVL